MPFLQARRLSTASSKCRLTCVLAGQTSHQSPKVTICVRRRIQMALEEAAYFIQVELVLLRMNARVACQSFNVCQDAGTARMKGRQEPMSWQSQCLAVFRVMHLQAQACMDIKCGICNVPQKRSVCCCAADRTCLLCCSNFKTHSPLLSLYQTQPESSPS